MSLSEICFYIFISFFLIASFFITVTSEDLKRDSIFKNYSKWTFLAGLSGIIVVLLDWTYLCDYNCILLTFAPFLTVIVIKLIAKTFLALFQREPYDMDEFGLRNGIWVKNKGDLKNRLYYGIYSTVMIFIPTLLLTGLFFFIEKNIC